MHLAPRVNIFWGDATEARALVYVRLEEIEGLPISPGQSIGHLQGPFADQVHTLPANYAIRLPTKGPASTAECLVPDPCFWTPRVPLFYKVSLSLPLSDHPDTPFTQMLGIRRLGVVATDLRWESRRWVLRGVAVQPSTELPLAALRETGTAVFVDAPNDAFCELASRKGAVIVARLDPSRDLDVDAAVDATVRRLSRWPAVIMVAMQDLTASTYARIRRHAPNLLVAQLVRGAITANAAAASDLLIVDCSSGIESIDGYTAFGKPVVIWQPGKASNDWQQDRVECDRLQARLAAAGKLSGYLVGGASID